MKLKNKIFMTQEELTILAGKIKDGIATKGEILTFHKELNKLLSDMKELLKNDEE